MQHPLRLLGRHGTLMLLLFFFLNSPSLYAGDGNALANGNTCYESCGLAGKLNREAFNKAYLKAVSKGKDLDRMAVIDFTLPSTKQRLFIIDLQSKKLLYSGLVAHGKGSGEVMAVNFSNVPESHQSSAGLYRIGSKIVSPKHGDALLLEGLEKGLNDNAKKREIILHAADYVSDDFVKSHGRCGRSFGCPAVSPRDLQFILQLLREGDLLYVYTDLHF
jgi:hypothetical protein